MKEDKETLSIGKLCTGIEYLREQDADYADLVEKNPKKAVEKITGSEIREDVNVTIYQNSAEKIYLILPPNPTELSEGDLDSVSGGGFFSDFGKGFLSVFVSPIETVKLLGDVITGKVPIK